MKIIEPSVEVITPIDPQAVMQHIELAGRVCYKSEDKIKAGSAEDFIRGIIKRGHESVLEHFAITVRFICDRGVSHELVRHRIASYSQESTRYCNYSGGKFDAGVTLIRPSFFNTRTEEGRNQYAKWVLAMEDAEYWYKKLLEGGATPQEARAVLPNSLKTEVIMSANLREWRHFLRLRCAPAAHPQMREVACMLRDQLVGALPVIFGDLADAETE